MKVRVRIDKTVDNCEDCPHFERCGDGGDPFCRHDKSPEEMSSMWTGAGYRYIKLKEEIHPECPLLKKGAG